MVFSAERLKQKAAELGFNIGGVIRAGPAPTLNAYFRWIEANMHGNMGYMARPDRQIRRKDLNMILPGVQSMILVGMDYVTNEIAKNILLDPGRGRIASYAWNLDYHDVMTPRLEQFAAWLSREMGGSEQRVYVDTGAILERAHAQQAGLGFIGKNTMLIHPRRGSYFFLGEILTDVEFDTYDTPGRPTMCGSCKRCLSACPTDAFPEPYVLDARRCISYLNIENKGMIARDLRPKMGNWVYGCDVCQEVCPWQRFAMPTIETCFSPQEVERVAPQLMTLLVLDDVTFKQHYYGSPIYRIKRARLVRNACVAAGNWGHPLVIDPLTRLLVDDNPLVRTHAAWALARIQGSDAHNAIKHVLNNERDAEAQLDMRQTLDEL